MDKIHIIGHTCIRITRTKISLKLTYLLESECLDCLEVIAEGLMHLPVCILLVDRKQLRIQGLGYDLSVFNLYLDRTKAKIPAMAAGIDKTYTVVLMDHRPVIVRTYNEIHASEALEKIESLALEYASVSVSSSRMYRNHDNI